MTLAATDPKTKTDIMILDPVARNAERARRALFALAHSGHADEPPRGAEALGDLLGDLIHFARHEGVDFRETLRLAEMHFTAEVNGEP